MTIATDDQAVLSQLRLFLTEICCDLCQFQQGLASGTPSENVEVYRDVPTATPDVFADIKVVPQGGTPYFVEIKFGYPQDRLVANLVRKFGSGADDSEPAGKLNLLVRSTDEVGWPNTLSSLRSALPSSLELEIWDERILIGHIHECFGQKIESITDNDLVSVRQAIDRAKWRHAFNDDAVPWDLAETLLWHFGYRDLRRLRETLNFEPHDVLKPGNYKDVAILMADISGFSSYVRDSGDHRLIGQMLTAFYSQARHAIHNCNGMMYQFIGDAVIGLFGLHDGTSARADDALDCARALLSVGDSVSAKWQRELDRVQQSKGVHVGISVGELALMPLQPFSASRIGFVGDAMNLAARLMGEAGPGRIVASNKLYSQLDASARQDFQELSPIDAKNIGSVKAWGK